MEKSETIGELAKALAVAQAKISIVVNDSRNPHFKSSYASLAAVRECAIPPLNECGLAVVQLPGQVQLVEADAYATLFTLLTHSTSGEWISGYTRCRLQKNDAQGMGSAITYLRRYSLAALVGLAQEDDDGEHAVARQTTSQSQPKAQADESEYKSVLVLLASARDAATLAAAKEAARKAWRSFSPEQQTTIKITSEQATRLIEGV